MNLPSSIVLEEIALGALLVIALLVLAVMSFVFTYHWRRFGMETPLFRKMRRLYFTVSFILAALAIVLYMSILGSL